MPPQYDLQSWQDMCHPDMAFSWQGAYHPDTTYIVDRVYYPDITYIVDSTCHPDMTYKIDMVHVTLICMFTKMLYSTWLMGYMQ